MDAQGGTVAMAKDTVILANAVDDPSRTNATQVENGCTIRSIFLNVQVLATTDVALGNAYFIIYKNPGNNISSANIPDANATGISDFRKMIFHTEMAMTSDTNDSIPITLFKGVLKLPRHMQRFGIGDLLELQLFSPGVDLDRCVQCIYKEIR